MSAERPLIFLLSIGAEMKFRFLLQAVIGLSLILVSTACASKATPTAVDHMATNIAMGVFIAQTRTAEAPTVTPSFTPTQTSLPSTATPTKGPIQPPTVVGFANCWLFGPGYSYSLDSHIKSGKQVKLIGVGSISGWYIIVNPYYSTTCWIQAANLNIDPNMDLSQIPMMTPYPLTTP